MTVDPSRMYNLLLLLPLAMTEAPADTFITPLSTFDVDSDTNFVLASWKLRTNLKLPWRPLISIDGSTIYELNEDYRIVRHVESWNVSAIEAVLQIFSINSENSGD
ncbi:unnamed protein product [Sphenostylis stenocarpa]|uniref:Uncharacterized protein n=1 Tax=Sphenostylis stenocarpa TaxID=92480 RepID=A0AA86T7X0_9FABA|nr:unnamed protein product [Sphenostylis stenocarpa]